MHVVVVRGFRLTARIFEFMDDFSRRSHLTRIRKKKRSKVLHNEYALEVGIRILEKCLNEPPGSCLVQTNEDVVPRINQIFEVPSLSLRIKRRAYGRKRLSILPEK